MDPLLREMLDLVVRWAHLIAGIMWIGNSMLFNWLDRNLEKDAAAPDTKMGTMWMLHGGGFYHVEKMMLEPGQMPKILHWFMWQSYTTWITGFMLLWIVYYFGTGLLVDPSVMAMHHHTAVAIGLGTVFGGFFVYDMLWRSPLGKHQPVAVAISLALLVGVVYGLTHVFSGRAAFLHVGALLGTCMSGNVFMHIIPSQKVLVEATNTGAPQDPSWYWRAKSRSIHNNYITFPMLFTMISNHFAALYGHPLNWVILLALFVGGASFRHVMNVRFTWGSDGWKPALAGVFFTTLAAVSFLVTRPTGAVPVPVASGAAPVTFAEAEKIVMARCATCHAAKPTDPDWPSPPSGVTLDTPGQIVALKDRIKARAVDSTTMPLGNKTAMTAEERALLGRWIAEGAKGP